MDATTNISPAMRNAIGGLLRRRVSFPIGVNDIRRWAMATYHPEEPPRIFWDEAVAAHSPHGGIVAPEEFNPFAWMAAEPAGLPIDANDPDDTENRLGIAGPGLKFQLNGGLTFEHGVRMRPGDVITSEWRLVDYYEREGRLGLMLFTESADVWTNHDGEVVRRSRRTLIRY